MTDDELPPPPTFDTAVPSSPLPPPPRKSPPPRPTITQKKLTDSGKAVTPAKEGAVEGFCAIHVTERLTATCPVCGLKPKAPKDAIEVRSRPASPVFSVTGNSAAPTADMPDVEYESMTTVRSPPVLKWERSGPPAAQLPFLGLHAVVQNGLLPQVISELKVLNRPPSATGAEVSQDFASPAVAFPHPPEDEDELVVNTLFQYGTISDYEAFQTRLNSRDKHGQTALHIAAALGRLNVCSVLVELGVSVTARCGRGETALQKACAARARQKTLSTFLRVTNHQPGTSNVAKLECYNRVIQFLRKESLLQLAARRLRTICNIDHVDELNESMGALSTTRWPTDGTQPLASAVVSCIRLRFQADIAKSTRSVICVMTLSPAGNDRPSEIKFYASPTVAATTNPKFPGGMVIAPVLKPGQNGRILIMVVDDQTHESGSLKEMAYVEAELPMLIRLWGTSWCVLPMERPANKKDKDGRSQQLLHLHSEIGLYTIAERVDMALRVSASGQGSFARGPVVPETPRTAQARTTSEWDQFGEDDSEDPGQKPQKPPKRKHSPWAEAVELRLGIASRIKATLSLLQVFDGLVDITEKVQDMGPDDYQYRLRARLKAYFEVHAPRKLATLDKTLAMFSQEHDGHVDEESLWGKVNQKYNTREQPGNEYWSVKQRYEGGADLQKGRLPLIAQQNEEDLTFEDLYVMREALTEIRESTTEAMSSLRVGQGKVIDAFQKATSAVASSKPICTAHRNAIRRIRMTLLARIKALGEAQQLIEAGLRESNDQVDSTGPLAHGAAATAEREDGSAEDYGSGSGNAHSSPSSGRPDPGTPDEEGKKGATARDWTIYERRQSHAIEEVRALAGTAGRQRRAGLQAIADLVLAKQERAQSLLFAPHPDLAKCRVALEGLLQFVHEVLCDVRPQFLSEGRRLLVAVKDMLEALTQRLARLKELEEFHKFYHGNFEEGVKGKGLDILNEATLALREAEVNLATLRLEAARRREKINTPPEFVILQNEVYYLENEFVSKHESEIGEGSPDIEGRLDTRWFIPSDQLELGAVVGTGSYGDVYQATYCSSAVAVKKLRDHSQTRDFIREFEVWSRLSFDYIIELRGYTQIDGFLAAVMPLCRTSLRSYLDDLHQAWATTLPRGAEPTLAAGSVGAARPLKQPNRASIIARPRAISTGRGRFENVTKETILMRAGPKDVGCGQWPHRLRLARQVAAAMQFLHTHKSGAVGDDGDEVGILHRDLKSENVLLQGASLDAKLCDFGFSKKVSWARSMSARGKGSPITMAPEVYFTGESTKAADVYSYGIVLWELLYALTPYYHLPPSVSEGSLFDMVRSGERPLTWPTDALPAILQPFQRLAEACWATSSPARPTFDQIIQQLEKFSQKISQAELDALPPLVSPPFDPTLFEQSTPPK